MELSDEELENVLGGAQKEVVMDKIDNNENVYRPRSIQEIREEKEVLLKKREELLREKGIGK